MYIVSPSKIKVFLLYDKVVWTSLSSFSCLQQNVQHMHQPKNFLSDDQVGWTCQVGEEGGSYVGLDQTTVERGLRKLNIVIFGSARLRSDQEREGVKKIEDCDYY